MDNRDCFILIYNNFYFQLKHPYSVERCILKSPPGTAQNAATIRKQAVSVPGLIYAVEQCERNLIILSKKTKVGVFSNVFIGIFRYFEKFHPLILYKKIKLVFKPVIRYIQS